VRRRTIVEWIVTLAVSALLVLVLEAEVVQPFRVPTSSMEPTLLCARPTEGCTARFNDRVLVAKIAFRFRDLGYAAAIGLSMLLVTILLGRAFVTLMYRRD